jgi:hypothetical protein
MRVLSAANWVIRRVIEFAAEATGAPRAAHSEGFIAAIQRPIAAIASVSGNTVPSGGI